MDTRKEFLKIMNEHTEIALATCADNQLNVRIVNFYYSEEENVLYFATFKNNEKVKEMRMNHHIAFTTIPHHGNAHVKGKEIVKKSSLTVYDVKDGFINRIPDYKSTIDNAGKYLELYEIEVKEVTVTLDLETSYTLGL
jgi:uncharacterized pyridoxamine 5'-phosphate oxidase family protein